MPGRARRAIPRSPWGRGRCRVSVEAGRSERRRDPHGADPPLTHRACARLSARRVLRATRPRRSGRPTRQLPQAESRTRSAPLHELQLLALDVSPGTDLASLPETLQAWRAAEGLPRRVWEQYLLRVAFTGIETAADAYSRRLAKGLSPAVRREIESHGFNFGDPIMELPPMVETQSPWREHPDVLARSPEPAAILYGATDPAGHVHYVRLERGADPPKAVVDALKPWRSVLESRAEIKRNSRSEMVGDRLASQFTRSPRTQGDRSLSNRPRPLRSRRGGRLATREEGDGRCREDGWESSRLPLRRAKQRTARSVVRGAGEATAGRVAQLRAEADERDAVSTAGRRLARGADQCARPRNRR